MQKSKRHRLALPEGYSLLWYSIGAVLGQGGFGITYLAKDTNLNRWVAIKEFLPSELVIRAKDGTVAPLSPKQATTYKWCFERFALEARTLARFEHPNIVHVLSVFRANRTAYMVMEYVRGDTFGQAVHKGRVRDEAQLRAITYRLLDGLDLVHKRGFIHRDLKPANILLRDNGVPLLLDFGSARYAMGTHTRTLTAMVSPGYAPIEQYGSAMGTDDKQGPWTDVYGLGATLYRTVTGRAPVDAAVRVNGLLAGKEVMPSAQTLAKGKYSPELLVAIDAALAIRPQDRPSSVAQWRGIFDGAPAPISTTETPAFTPMMAPPARRSPASTVAPATATGDQTVTVTVPVPRASSAAQSLQDRLLKELGEWEQEHSKAEQERERDHEARNSEALKRKQMEEVQEEHALAKLLDALRAEKGAGVVRLVKDIGRAQPWEKFRLTEAVQRAADEDVLVLLASGADPTVCDPKGTSPLEYARRAGRTKLVKYLTVAIRLWRKQHAQNRNSPARS